MGEDEIDPLAPAQKKKTIWRENMAIPKPFLMPHETKEGQIVQTLPPEKPNRKIKWADDVELCEMPNRRQLGLMDEEEEEDDNSYEIEIVEDDGDADFYLEIVDGEIFYVFETEDDSDEEMVEDNEDDQSDTESGPMHAPLQLAIESMMAPSLDGDDNSAQVVQFVPEVTPMEPPATEQEVHVIEDDREPMDVEQAPSKPSKDEIHEEETDVSSHSQSQSQQQSEHEEVQEQVMVAEPVTMKERPLSEADLSTPVTSPEQQTKPKVQLTSSAPQLPSFNAAPKAPPSPGPSPGRSILKACPPSPRRKLVAKDKEKDKKKPKTVTKTYVRADTFDGEHQVFTWQKPDWADENKLKKTERGEDVRKGANLASPITFPKQGKKGFSAEEGKPDVYEDEHGNVIDKDELVRRIQNGDQGVIAFVPRPTYGGKYQRKLRFSENGQKVRSGLNIEKPITMATVDRKRDDINLVAQPNEILKKHVTTSKKKYQWEKPEWIKSIPLKTSDHGDSPSKNRKEYKWASPEWTKKKLSTTSMGSAIKSGANLEKPITQTVLTSRRHSGGLEEDDPDIAAVRNEYHRSGSLDSSSPIFFNRDELKELIDDTDAAEASESAT